MIDLVREVPEAMKPRRVDIKTTDGTAIEVAGPAAVEGDRQAA